MQRFELLIDPHADLHSLLREIEPTRPTIAGAVPRPTWERTPGDWRLDPERSHWGHGFAATYTEPRRIPAVILSDAELRSAWTPQQQDPILRPKGLRSANFLELMHFARGVYCSQRGLAESLTAAYAQIWIGGPDDPVENFRGSSRHWHAQVFMVTPAGRTPGGLILTHAETPNIVIRHRGLHWLAVEDVS